MKQLLLTFMLTFTFSNAVMAGNLQVVQTDACKTRATLAAFFDMKKKSSHDMFDAKAKLKSAKEGKFLHHFIDITNLMTMKTLTVTVTVDPKTCDIKDIN